MKFSRILVAYDGGGQAKKALEAAIAIAKNGEGEIILLSASGVYKGDPAVDFQMQPSESLRRAAQDYMQKLLDEAADLVKAQNIPVVTEIRDGMPGPIIVEIAESKGCDLIAIGSHNHGTLYRAFLGSVSNYVLQNSPGLLLIAKDE